MHEELTCLFQIYEMENILINVSLYHFRILVLDKGQIKEFDSPDNLLKDHSSIFYGLAKEAGIIS